MLILSYLDMFLKMIVQIGLIMLQIKSRNLDEIDAVTESGHRNKDADKLDVNKVFGHVSGQVVE